MKKPPRTSVNPTGHVTVLSVSPIVEDHISLRQILQPSERDAHSYTPWRVNENLTLTSAVGVLRQCPVPVVICERDLQPGTWKEMLEHVGRLASPPLLIVSSRLADGRLWAEALNLGAFDVLAKPFDKIEVIRVVASAWRHWLGPFPACAHRARGSTATA